MCLGWLAGYDDIGQTLLSRGVSAKDLIIRCEVSRGFLLGIVFDIGDRVGFYCGALTFLYPFLLDYGLDLSGHEAWPRVLFPATFLCL